MTILHAAVVNLGCPKNEVDAEKLVYLLRNNGFGLLAEPENAEVIIVNTCAFIQPAVEEAIETILSLAQYKKTGACRILTVCGCLPQRYGAELLKEIPEIDILAGADAFPQIPEAVKSFTKESPAISLIRPTAALD